MSRSARDRIIQNAKSQPVLPPESCRASSSKLPSSRPQTAAFGKGSWSSQYTALNSSLNSSGGSRSMHRLHSSTMRDAGVTGLLSYDIAEAVERWKGVLSLEEIQMFQEAFAVFDTDANGVIDAPDLIKVFKSVDPTREVNEDEVRAMIASIDGDSSGTVEFSEFLILMSRRPPPPPQRTSTSSSLPRPHSAVSETPDPGITKDVTEKKGSKTLFLPEIGGQGSRSASAQQRKQVLQQELQQSMGALFGSRPPSAAAAATKESRPSTAYGSGRRATLVRSSTYAIPELMKPIRAVKGSFLERPGTGSERNERGGNSADSGLEQVWEAELSEAFEAMDVDGDGLISVSDLSAVLSDVGEKNVTNEEVADMLREADADGDGFVGFEDFCKMLLGTIILK